MPENPGPEPTPSLRDTVRGWLEAAGWTFEEVDRWALGASLAEGELRWIATVAREPFSMLAAEPVAAPERLIVCRSFSLEPLERNQIDALDRGARTQLVWDLLSGLNLLEVEYLIDAPVPHAVMLFVCTPREGLTRALLLRHLQRLSAALRLASLAYAKALGTLTEEPAVPSVH
jgi:hypothetical protein